jgi:hypothetical protein
MEQELARETPMPSWDRHRRRMASLKDQPSTPLHPKRMPMKEKLSAGRQVKNTMCQQSMSHFSQLRPSHPQPILPRQLQQLFSLLIIRVR